MDVLTLILNNEGAGDGGNDTDPLPGTGPAGASFYYLPCPRSDIC